MFKLVENKNVLYYRSDIFPENVNHAFTTRKGGYAPEPLNSLSTGTAQYKEFSEYIIKNRQLLCSILNMDIDKLVMTDQEHTDNIAVLDNGFKLSKNGYLPSTDAVITIKQQLPSMLFFADCTPIILYDTQTKALGLIHAGWKGTAKRITVKTAQLMIETYGSKPENIIAAIGPNIGQCCYEVSQDVADQLLSTIPKQTISDTILKYKNLKPYVSLKEINALQLKSYNIKEIDISSECTSCNQELFFSHRMTNGKTGRQSLIAQLN